MEQTHWIAVAVQHDGRRQAPTTEEIALAIDNGETSGDGWSITEAKPSVERVINEVPPGYISMDRARHLASTYDGGEGHHPLARHRDSMG